MTELEDSSFKSSKTYFNLGKDKVYFSGDFDSGNLQKVQQLSAYTVDRSVTQYRITPGYDQLNSSTRKTFFHFQVFGFHKCTVKFQITRCHLLETLIKHNFSNNIFHPVVRRSPEGTFQKVKSKTQIYYNAYDQPELSFFHDFSQSNWAQFAFSYPYTYTDCQNFQKEIEQTYSSHSTIYFHRELLYLSRQGRRVDLLTITDIQNCKEEKQKGVQGIFPENKRPYRIEKPKIVVSARVHPGQTPSSYCLEGIVRFLLNEKDLRAALLRKHFHFIIIPMLNPDGVFEGAFRTDPLGHNLNRFYKHCDQKQQPTIWAVTTLLSSLQRVDFFFDLHAHPSLKSFFIYGNAFESLWYQVEAQLFGKLVEFNCPFFQNIDSIFTERAMKTKDKYDQHNKQGCARVFYHNRFKIIHSYTVECGYYWPTKLAPFAPYTCPSLQSSFCYTSDWQPPSENQYQSQSYMFLGKSLMISILDLFNINPYSRMGLNAFDRIDGLRRTLGQRMFGEVDRFRLREKISFKKINEITSIINQKYYKSKYLCSGISILMAQSGEKVKKQIKKVSSSTQSINSLSISALKQQKSSLLCPRESFDSQSQLPPDVQDSNVHHQLLSSFSRYNQSKQSNIKIRKLKTLEGEAQLRKSLKSFHFKTEQDESAAKKIESQVLERLIRGKLEGANGSVVKVREGRLASRYQWNKDKKGNENNILPALKNSMRKIVLTSSTKSINTQQ